MKNDEGREGAESEAGTKGRPNPGSDLFFAASALALELVASGLNADDLFLGGEAQALTDATFQGIDMDVVEFDDLVAVDANQVVVIGVIDVIRVVEFVVLPEIHLLEHPALHQQREGPINRRTRHR